MSKLSSLDAMWMELFHRQKRLELEEDHEGIAECNKELDKVQDEIIKLVKSDEFD